MILNAAIFANFPTSPPWSSKYLSQAAHQANGGGISGSGDQKKGEKAFHIIAPVTKKIATTEG
jgi:hypothetical protein